jgi:hypothetical protein
MAVASAAVIGAIWLGKLWWGSAEGDYLQVIFKPLELRTTLEGGRLELQLADPGWLGRRTDDLLPDHGHLMHLYVLRLPAMDLVWHLHPEPDASGGFTQPLPPMPAGRYALFGDVVHANGLAETATAEIALPAIAGRPLTGDDAGPGGYPTGAPIGEADYNRNLAALPGGLRMVWDRGKEPLHARRPYLFRFRVEDSQGNPAGDMELYMGMLGHAAFVRSDRSVFAHVHPSGSAPMAALALTEPENPHAGHIMAAAGLPSEVSFPYGFPKPGAYRIYVQVKRGGEILTGVFDARVEN